MYKKALLLTITLLLYSQWSLANYCKDAHLNRADRRKDQQIINTKWKSNQFKFIGGWWLVMGIGFAGSISTFPIVMIAAGGAVVTKSIIASVQEPRYRFLYKALLYQETTRSSEIFEDPYLFKLTAKIQIDHPEVTADKIAHAFIDGIETGEFCHRSGKPFSFTRMKKNILQSL